MIQRSWLLAWLSLLLVLSACAPLAPPSIEVIGAATPAAVESAPEVEVAEVEVEAEIAPEPSTPIAEDTATPEIESEPASLGITYPAADFELDSRVLEMAGTGEPGSQLQVLIDGQVVDTVIVRSGGRWYLVTSLAQPGEYELQLQRLDDSGSVVAETEPINILAEFETEAPAETEAEAPVEAEAEEPPEAETTASTETDTDASAETETEEPAAADEDAPVETDVAPPIFIFPADQADIFLGNLTLLGLGEPGAEVEVLVDEELLASVNVEAGGGWGITFQPSLGVHQVSARTPGQDAAEADLIEIRVVTPSDEYDCNSNPGLVLDTLYVVGTCDTMVTIGQQLEIDVEDLISANPQVDDPDLIYPGEIISLPQ